MTESLIFAATVLMTFFCLAIDWHTHRSTYPLWRWVGGREFGPLHRKYESDLPVLIFIPHGLLILTSGLLCFWSPGEITLAPRAAAFVLNVSVVVFSVGWAAPIHAQFDRENAMDGVAYQRLMTYSAIRVMVMLTSALLVFWQLIVLGGSR